MTTDLVIRDSVILPVNVEEAVEEWEQYQELTKRLLDAKDYQVNGSVRFKKKSAWRKYAKAFNISDSVTFEQIERAADGYPLWARIRVQAVAPNGRTSEADHEVHVTERCCPAARGIPCPREGWSNHRNCCLNGCDGRAHWSHPGDLPATALTRAKNRAISDLIGAGEVSAEEMDRPDPADNVIQPQRGATQPAAAKPRAIDGRVASPQAATPPDDAPPWQFEDIPPPFDDEEPPEPPEPLPLCGVCGNEVYDNRGNKRNPKGPDFTCKKCRSVAWLSNGAIKEWRSPLPTKP